jgi:1-acyl-sn-glycerol-3-phosphate acyltransferase
MKRSVRFIASLWFWTELFLVSALLFPVSLTIFVITFAFDPKRKANHIFSAVWSRVVLALNPMWKLTVLGRENLLPGTTYVMVPNHQSGADIILLFRLDTHFKWIAKRSLFNFPFIGWNMWLNGYIPLVRGSSGSMRRMLIRASRNLQEGNSLMIFPEGTRSRDGNLQPFKTGAFQLAITNRVPVLPVVISGTSQAIRKNGFLIDRNHNIKAIILPAITDHLNKAMDSKQLSELARNAIAQTLETVS